MARLDSSWRESGGECCLCGGWQGARIAAPRTDRHGLLLHRLRAPGNVRVVGQDSWHASVRAACSASWRWQLPPGYLAAIGGSQLTTGNAY